MKFLRWKKSLIIITCSVFSILYSAFFTSLLSQEKEKYIRIELPPVETISTLTQKDIIETSYDVSLVTSKEIKEKGFLNVADVVRSISGALSRDIGNRGMLATSSLRASISAHTLVLVDGKRINIPSLGLTDFNKIPVPIENIERIEILKGTSSALYGSEAIGGVVNIITKKIEKNYVYSNSYFGTYRTFHKETYTAFRKKNFGFDIGLMHENSVGHRPNSEYEIKSLGTKLQYFFSDQSILSFNLNTLVNNAGSPGSISFPSSNANIGESNTLLGINFLSKNIVSNLYFHSFVTNYIDEFSETTTKNFIYAFDIRKMFQVSNSLAFTAGLELSKEILNNVDFKEPANSIGRKVRGRMSGFYQLEWDVSKNINLLAGIRYDNIGGKDHFSPRTSVNFKLSESMLLGVNYGHGFRIPTFNDLFWPDTQFAKGNPDLKPEISDEYELLLKFFKKNYNGKINIFIRNVRDLIIWTPDQNFKFSPQNIAKVKTSGIGFENYINFEKIDIGFSFDFFHPIDKTTNSYVRFSPKYQIKPYINYYITDNLILSIQYYLIQQYVVNPGDISTYDILDFKLSQKINVKGTEGEIFLIGKNIFDRDTQYTLGYPIAGAQIYTGFSLHF